MPVQSNKNIFIGKNKIKWHSKSDTGSYYCFNTAKVTYSCNVFHENGEDLSVVMASKISNDAVVAKTLEQLDVVFELLHFLNKNNSSKITNRKTAKNI